MDTDDSKPRSNWFWPKVDSPEGALKAAKEGAISYGFLALGYVLSLVFMYFGIHNPAVSHQGVNAIALVIDLLILCLAIYLAWHTYKRPTLTLCIVALVWTGLEFSIKASNMGLGNGNVLGMYWGQIIGTVAGVSGVRGAFALRRLQQGASNQTQVGG